MKRWTPVETHWLKRCFHIFTIKELMQLLPGKSQEAINGKAKRLRKEGYALYKTKAARARAFRQRGKRG